MLPEQLEGTLRPGETVRNAITFRSWREGIYKELWRLDTKPVLNGSQPILVLFCGISVWPTPYQFQSMRPNAPNTEVKRAPYEYYLNVYLFSVFHPSSIRT